MPDDAAQSGNSEYIMPGLWWSEEDGKVCGIVWRQEGPRQPFLDIRARSWEAMQNAIQNLCLELTLAEDELKGGHLASDPEWLERPEGWRISNNPRAYFYGMNDPDGRWRVEFTASTGQKRELTKWLWNLGYWGVIAEMADA